MKQEKTITVPIGWLERLVDYRENLIKAVENVPPESSDVRLNGNIYALIGYLQSIETLLKS